MSKILLLLAFSLASVSVLAETIVFRSGEVLAAEVTSRAPRVAHLAEADKAESPMYALVTVKLHPGREISTEDYSLSALGGLYRCVAIREENGAFDAEVWHRSPASPKKKYGLLFILQIPVSQKYDNAKFDLVCNAPGKWNRASLPVVDRHGQDFTLATSIPNTGKFPAAK